MKYLIHILIFGFTVVWSGNSFAGIQALSEPIYNFKQVANLAKGLERSLAARRVLVAIIGRVGLKPELLPPGVRFSHAGFAVYSMIKTSDGRLLPGYAVYNLYGSLERTARSHLAQDYPVDYLAISQKLEVGVVVPNKSLQALLIRTINSESYRTLHNPNYSVNSNPFNLKYQNCTEFVLDVIFSAIYDTEDPRKIKSFIAAYFKPQPVRVNELDLTFAAMTIPEVRLDDHDGQLVTTTFTSIARFLMENGLAQDAFIYSVEPTTLYGKISMLEL